MPDFDSHLQFSTPLGHFECHAVPFLLRINLFFRLILEGPVGLRTKMRPMISCQEETMMRMTADYYLESPPPPSSLPQHSSPPSSSPNTSGVKIFLMNLMVASSHPPALTSHHADPHDPHCAAPSHISPSLHFHCSSSPRPLQRFLCSGHTPIFLPFLLSFLVFVSSFFCSPSPPPLELLQPTQLRIQNWLARVFRQQQRQLSAPRQARSH